MLVAVPRAQVSDYRRAASALDACTYCFASSRRPRHLTIAIGQTCYVMLPPRCLNHDCIGPSINDTRDAACANQ